MGKQQMGSLAAPHNKMRASLDLQISLLKMEQEAMLAEKQKEGFGGLQSSSQEREEGLLGAVQEDETQHVQDEQRKASSGLEGWPKWLQDWQRGVVPQEQVLQLPEHEGAWQEEQEVGSDGSEEEEYGVGPDDGKHAHEAQPRNGHHTHPCAHFPLQPTQAEACRQHKLLTQQLEPRAPSTQGEQLLGLSALLHASGTAQEGRHPSSVHSQQSPAALPPLEGGIAQGGPPNLLPGLLLPGVGMSMLPGAQGVGHNPMDSLNATQSNSGAEERGSSGSGGDGESEDMA
eukprot:scaffold60810_cov17-Tisochrysis_lutea.AAC.1